MFPVGRSGRREIADALKVFQFNGRLFIVANRSIGPSIFAQQGWIFGVVMAAIVALILIGGIKSIAKVTEKLVPIMVGIYIAGALAVLFAHTTEIPAAIG